MKMINKNNSSKMMKKQNNKRYKLIMSNYSINLDN